MEETDNRPVILVLDDAPFELKRDAGILGKSYKTLLAKTPEIAFTTLSRRTPDLILLDVEMPEMSGIDFFKQATEKGLLHDAKVVFLSSHTEADLISEVTALGAKGFITKPVNPDALLAKVKEVIEGEGAQ
jgi:putative two-component system response regulator